MARRLRLPPPPPHRRPTMAVVEVVGRRSGAIPAPLVGGGSTMVQIVAGAGSVIPTLRGVCNDRW